MKRIRVLTRTILCLFFVSMVWIGQGSAEEPLQSLIVQLDWRVAHVSFAGIVIAKEQGWYEEQGIDLTIKIWEAGMSPIDEIVSGKAHIGVAEGALLIEARTTGTPLKAIATQFQKSPLCLMSKKEKGITTLEQLVGKKVGVSSPNTVLMTKIVLASNGLQYDDITPIQTQGDLQLLINDDVDVFTGFMNNQPLIMEARGYNMNYLPAFKYGYDFYSKVYFVTEELIQERPELIQTFLDVTFRGWAEAFKDPTATAQLVVEKYYPQGSVQHQTRSLEILHSLATLGIGDDRMGFMEERVWANGIDMLYSFGQITENVSASDVYTLEFLKKASF